MCVHDWLAQMALDRLVDNGEGTDQGPEAALHLRPAQLGHRLGLDGWSYDSPGAPTAPTSCSATRIGLVNARTITSMSFRVTRRTRRIRWSGPSTTMRSTPGPATMSIGRPSTTWIMPLAGTPKLSFSARYNIEQAGTSGWCRFRPTAARRTRRWQMTTPPPRMPPEPRGTNRCRAAWLHRSAGRLHDRELRSECVRRQAGRVVLPLLDRWGLERQQTGAPPAGGYATFYDTVVTTGATLDGAVGLAGIAAGGHRLDRAGDRLVPDGQRVRYHEFDPEQELRDLRHPPPAEGVVRGH